MEIVVAVGAVIGLVAVLVWIGALLWAARADGRDQDDRDRRNPRR